MEKLLLRGDRGGEGEGGCRVRGRVGNPGGSRGGPLSRNDTRKNNNSLLVKPYNSPEGLNPRIYRISRGTSVERRDKRSS